MGSYHPEDSTRGISVERTVVNLQNACRESFERLQTESKKTLDLLAQAKRSPDNLEVRTALRSQLDKEGEAQAQYERQRHLLYTLLIGPDEAERTKPKHLWEGNAG